MAQEANIRIFRCFDQEGPCAVAKKDASCTISVIDDAGHGIAADYEHFAVRSRHNKMRGHGCTVEKARTSCEQIETPSARGAQTVLNDASGRREEHIRRDSTHD